MNVWKNEEGQSVVMVSVIMALLALGFLAFALDIGSVFRTRRAAQSAADAAALAAAVELAAGNTSGEQTVANGVATLNGFNTSAASNPASVALTTPSTGNFTGSNYVQATVSMPVKTLFLSAFYKSLTTMTVSASSIAGGAQTSSTCVCLDGTSGQDLNMNNGSKLSAPSCGFMENSGASNAIVVTQGATLSALSIGTVSNDWNNTTNVSQGGTVSSSHIVQGMSSGCSVTMPTAPSYSASSCLADPGGTSSNFTAGPASSGGTICYTSLTVGANNSQDTLKPGIYIVTGTLHFMSGNSGKSNLGGNGVFFYLPGSATFTIDNGANVNLVAGGATESDGKTTAPSTGTYNNVLIYQPASNTSGVNIQGGSTAYLSGSILAPGAPVTMGNGSGSTVTGSITASTLFMNGGGTLTATTTTNEGSLAITSPKVVQ